ncbi:acetyl-CoA C-acetyltransferase [Oceanotoga teriensis]|uniref:Acetyl-CoA C-acetyltransferase n=1 Tax=Oceanotoga teriensis TaxID=515440 RepID=A0AA45C989_9BACT|nr:acetyl-CoA C-acetyltransferase [Oceanotoga teriensis]PWJ96641.1 acetyl-CoA C-acetyltransferase [Oceanotoga teriensis]
MSKVFIIDAKRTALGTFGGTLKNEPASKLGAHVLKEMISINNLSPNNIDETIIGNILGAGQGMGPGRQVAIYAGIPVESPAYTINMICGSGMKAVMIGATDIMSEQADLVVAGGIENMSMAPYLINSNNRFGSKMGNQTVIDHMINDSLTDVFNQYHMGVTAENIAQKYNISREEQDEFAYTSQLRANQAIENGRFKDEIIPYKIKTRKGEVVFDTDEHPRLTSVEKLGMLRPAFKKDGTVTAGNSSGINDGASIMILASEEAVEKYNLKPIAEIIAFSQAGVDPAFMGLGPVPAIKKVMEKTGLSLDDISLFELNEAFASQSLGVIKELSDYYKKDKNWFMERTNLNGGAIALGHPVGASGNRIIVTLIHEMLKQKKEYGLASLCIGGGMGTAIVIRNLI